MEQQIFSLENAEGKTIHGTVHVADSAPDHTTAAGRPVVVICHGFKGYQDWGFFPHIADTLATAGFAAVRFNFSGSGMGADGAYYADPDGFFHNTFSRDLADVAAVLDAVTQGRLPHGTAVDVSRIGLLGHSRGGGIALLAAARDPRVTALVTWASVPTFSWFQDQADQWRQDGYLTIVNARTGDAMRVGTDLLDDMEQQQAALNIPAHAAKMTTPTLVVHGEADTTVPVESARIIHDALGSERKTLCLIPDAGHTFEATHPFAGSNPHLDQALTATVDWFRTALP